jgi:nucleoside 2-deoxyribosyltransferase
MSYFYLATPYSKYKAGFDAAHIMACEQAALLIKDGLVVYSPIAHTHPIAMHGNIDPTHNFNWLALDAPLMDAACGIIVCMMDGWLESRGVQHEIEVFQRAGKPVYYMMPGHVPYELTKRYRATVEG